MNNEPASAMNAPPAAFLLDFKRTSKAWWMRNNSIRLANKTGATVN